MYSKTQFFSPLYEFIANVGIALFGEVLFLFGFFLTGHAWFSLLLAFFLTLVILVWHWLIFYKLTVAIDDQHITMRYGVGFIKREFPLVEIVDCEPVRQVTTNFLLWDSFSWNSVMVWPMEKTFSSSDRVIVLPMRGWPVIRLRMHSKDNVVVGTGEPQRLIEAIQKAKIKRQKN